MKFSLLIVLTFLIYASSFAQNTPGKTFGGFENDIGLAVCQVSDGGFLLAGTTRSYGAGSSDIYLIRLDKEGSTLWTKTYGWPHKDVIRSVISVSDGFVITGDVWDYGYARLDIYLMKIDTYGNLLWDQIFGTNSRELGFKVIPSNDGGYLILGYTRGIDPVGDLWLIKTDVNGVQIWSKNYGSQFDDYGFDLIQNNTGEIYMIGSKGGFFDDIHANFRNNDSDIYLIKADNNGNEIWQKTFGGDQHDFGQSITISEESGFYLFGSSQSNGVGSFDMTLIKTDVDLNEVWSKSYGGLEYDYGISMDKNGQDDLFLFGSTKSFGINESSDFYLVKTDKHGEEIWSLTIGGKYAEFGQQVISTSDNGCAVIGQSNSFGEGEFDFLFTKVNKDGLIEYFINGVDTTFEGEALVYPNPLRGSGRVKFDINYQHENYRMEIVSLTGIVNRTVTIYAPDYNFYTSQLEPGLYIYRIISEESSNIVFKGKLVVH